MRLIWSKCKRTRGQEPPDCLQLLLNVFKIWHGESTYFVIKELHARRGCPRQKLHRDCPIQTNGRLRRSDINFSFLLAVEPSSNPTKLILEDESELMISQGEGVIWRGDYLHAGASYQVENSRLFISITSVSTIKLLENVEIKI